LNLGSMASRQEQIKKDNMAKERPKEQKTLCIVLDRVKERILLAMKKRNFGAGKYNGFGGRVEAGETVEQAAIRELREESLLEANITHLKKAGEIDFYFPHKPEFDQTVHVYLLEQYRGEPKETDEMAFKWFDVKAIPYHQMWDDDKYWLPKVLEGKKLRASFTFKEVNGENIVNEQDMREVQSL